MSLRSFWVLGVTVTLMAVGVWSDLLAWFRGLSDRDATLVLFIATAATAALGWLFSQLIPLLVGKLFQRQAVVQVLIQLRRESLPKVFPEDTYLRWVDVARKGVLPGKSLELREFRNPGGAPIWWDGADEPQPRWMQSARCEVTNLSSQVLVRLVLNVRFQFQEVVQLTETQQRSGRIVASERVPIELTKVPPSTPIVFWITNRDKGAFVSVEVDERATALVAGDRGPRRAQVVRQRDAMEDAMGVLMPSDLKGRPTTGVSVMSNGKEVTVSISGEAFEAPVPIEAPTTAKLEPLASPELQGPGNELKR